MDLEDRISRRFTDDGTTRPVRDYRALNPAVHLEEPVNRGPVLERLLDWLGPAFDGDLPSNAYVWGPAGSGKSAVLTALFDQLNRQLSAAQDGIFTVTRVAGDSGPQFVYVDARSANSEFRLYRQLLEAITGTMVPEGGVSTEELRERLDGALSGSSDRAVVAVDHLGEPETMGAETVSTMLAPLSDSTAWVGVCRRPPAEARSDPDVRVIEVPAYELLSLEDLLSSRTTDGLAAGVLSHDRVRRVAQWADGNAHDGLSALFGAAVSTRERGAESITEEDLSAGIGAVPEDGAPIGRVLALRANRQSVLRELIDLDPGEGSSVEETATAIASGDEVDLSPGTVERVLYELAERGILERVEHDRERSELGRPPSRVVPRFPALVFRHLYDAEVAD